MKRLLTALLSALVLAAGLLVASTPPASAAGWSGQRCDDQPGNGFRVCVQVHVIDHGKNNSVSLVHQCMYQSGTYAHARNTFGNLVQFRGSGGANLGFTSLPNTNKGDCTYREVGSVTSRMGNGACYEAQGRVNLGYYPDKSWYVRGSILGGPC